MNIPLIRAAALAPILRWMREHGRDAEVLLQNADLGWYSDDKPLDPIPLRQACLVLSLAAKQEGPDLPWRAVGSKGFLELGLLASIGLQASTPRQIMTLVQSGMTAHCTHETFNVSAAKNGDLIVEDGWMMHFDNAEVLHSVHQYCTAMVDMICRLTNCPEPVLSRVSMVPHPETGFDHLGHALGNRVCDDGTKVLHIVISREVADTPISLDGIEASPLPVAGLVPLKDGKSISYTVSLLIKGMLRDGAVDIDRICSAVGMKRRSLQRGLSVEGTTFSKVLDETRRQMAMDMMQEQNLSLGTIAVALGYKNQSAFSRAFQRWEGCNALKVKNRLAFQSG